MQVKPRRKNERERVTFRSEEAERSWEGINVRVSEWEREKERRSERAR